MSLHLSHHTRRTLAASDTQSPMDPTHKNNTKPTTTAAKNRRNPPPVDHPITDPSSTIQNISQRISRLYSNNKKHDVANSFKPRNNLHQQREPHAQTKPITLSPLSDTSCTTLTKSSSQNETRLSLVKKDRYFISSKAPKAQSFVEFDVDKASKLMSKSMDSGNEEIKKKKDKKMLLVHQPQGFESRRTSASSMVVVNGVGRRRSFHNSQVELADFLSCNGVRVVAVDMPPFMQIHAVDCARKAHDSLEKFTSKTLALTLKKEFDGVYGPAWHCIVGTSFGSFVTHSVGGFMYFSMDHKLYILLFKTTVQRAE